MVPAQRELATGRTNAAGESDHHDDRAVHAVMTSKRTKQPPEVVRAILERHANGKKTNDICDEFGLHHSTVSRIIATAIDRQDRGRLNPASMKHDSAIREVTPC